MKYVKYEVALIAIAEVNNNIMQACSTEEEKKFQLAKFQNAISNLGQASFKAPITGTRVVYTESIREIIGYELFTNMDFTKKLI